MSEKQAFDVLDTVLKDGQPWEKVHAAEFLIALGKTGSVQDVFLKELDQNGHQPEYRIGIWRVLYKCAEENEKQIWQDSIYNAFILSESPDRIHAAETLAKLKITAKNTDVEIVESAIASPDQRLSFFSQWWITPQNEGGIEKLKAYLLPIIQSDEKSVIRYLAAYVLCEDTDLSINTGEWQILQDIAVSEPVDSDVRLQLLTAAFSKADNDSIQATSLRNIKKMMLEYTNSTKSNVYQLCVALARKGGAEDIGLLKSLLHHHENDVKIAAAYAMQQINNQTNHSN